MPCGLCSGAALRGDGARSASRQLPLSNMTASERLNDMGYSVAQSSTLCRVCLAYLEDLDTLMTRAAELREKIAQQASRKPQSITGDLSLEPDVVAAAEADVDGTPGQRRHHTEAARRCPSGVECGGEPTNPAADGTASDRGAAEPSPLPTNGNSSGGSDWNARWRRKSMRGQARLRRERSKRTPKEKPMSEPKSEPGLGSIAKLDGPLAEDRYAAPPGRTPSKPPAKESGEPSGGGGGRSERAGGARAPASCSGPDGAGEGAELFRLGRRIVTKQRDGSATPVVKVMRKDAHGGSKVAFLDHKAAVRAARRGRVGVSEPPEPIDWDTVWRRRTLGQSWRPRQRPRAPRVMVKPPTYEQADADQAASLLLQDVGWMAGGDGPAADVETRPWLAAEGAVHTVLNVLPGEAWEDAIARTEATAVRVKTEPGSPAGCVDDDAQLPVPVARIKTEPAE